MSNSFKASGLRVSNAVTAKVVLVLIETFVWMWWLGIVVINDGYYARGLGFNLV
jgi:hypothetical protein